MDSRARILAEAMRLFGEQGFTKTTIAGIERAAGLSGGSGALYRHFGSKEELLAEGVRTKIAGNAGLLSALSDPGELLRLPLRGQLEALTRAGLRRLDEERDLNRMVVRDLAAFPELLAEVREGEMRRVQAAMAQWLRMSVGAGAAGVAGGPGPEGGTEESPRPDWDALAVVLVGAVSHFWLLRDVFGDHPSGIGEDRCIAAVVELAAGLIGTQAGS